MNTKRNAKISIQLESESVSAWKFLVTITESNAKHERTVTLDKEYYHNISQGKVLPLVLVQESIFYLLEREPAESILAEFSLEDISRYFPRYEADIQKNLGL